MTRVYTGTAADAHEIVRGLVCLGVDSASTTDPLGWTTVFVAEENLEEAQVLLDAIEQVDLALRVRDARAFLAAVGAEGRVSCN